MTYIKTFEDNNTPALFKVGDFVYADNTNQSQLDKDIKYEVSHVEPKTTWNPYTYQLKEIKDKFFWEYRFISELEYYAKKYNL